MSKNHYTAQELADLTGLTKRRIIQLINEGVICAEKRWSVFGKYWGISGEDAKRFIENRN